MSTKMIVSGVAATALIAAAVVIGTSDEEPEALTVTEALATAAAVPSTPATPETTEPGQHVIEAPEAAAATTGVADRELLTATGTVLAGRVVDAATSQPVRRFFVLLSHRGGLDESESASLGTVERRMVGTPDGRFRFALQREGVYRLAVFTSRHRQETLDDLRVEGPDGITDLVVRLDAGRSLAGRVVDDRTDRPVEGAVVGTSKGSTSDQVCLLQGETERCLHATSGADGRFTLSGLTDESQAIAAVHPEFAEGWQKVVPSELEFVEIRLKSGAVIHGTVYDDVGKPIEGVWIRMYGDEIPLERALISGKDGTYRTPPVRPGTVELHATPPGDEDEDAFGFSSEWRVAKVEKADVQVDFGVQKDYVTWRGTFHGEDGEPQPSGRIHAMFWPADLVNYERHHGDSRIAVCDEAGRFEFRKMPPGRYRLYLRLADGSRYRTNPGVHLEHPGVLEHDIRLAAEVSAGKGCEIHGMVVESGTGLPVRSDTSPRVRATQSVPTRRMHTTDVDDQGRFHLVGLPPGGYSLYASADRRSSGHLWLNLQEGEVIRDIRLAVQPLGELRIRLLGFRDVLPRDFQYSLVSEEGARSRDNEGSLAENGTFEARHSLRLGAWRALLTVNELGQAERPFRVRDGAVAKVDFRPSDLIPFASGAPRTFTVEGTLAWADGSPIQDQFVSIYGHDVPGLADADRSKLAKTDDEGKFTIGGLRPGTYWVSPSLEGGTMVDCDDLVISLNDVDPISLRLVAPGGVLSGSLHDARTGEPLDEQGPLWWIWLRDSESSKTVCQIQGGHTGTHFELKGVPKGQFQLLVSARGYQRYASEPFDYVSRFEKDLGRIDLEPTGVLEFEVVNADGQAIEEFDVYLDGRIIPAYRRTRLEDGRIALYELPLGAVTLEVSADGYQTTGATITLKAGKQGQHRFVLPNNP